MSRALKVGIIGVGGIAQTHIPGWMASPDAEIVAIGDIAPAPLDRTGDRFDIDRRYDDGYSLIADPDVDIVDICTPNEFHLPLTIAALEAGKHVICEKPLTLRPDDIRKMIAARDRSGTLLMCAQHHRFNVPAEALKREIDTGVLGDIYHARAWMLRRCWAGITPTFASRELSGGGALIDIGVHVLDLALWMMGNPKPVSVSGNVRTDLAKAPGAFSIQGLVPPDFDVDESAFAFVRFATGATLVLEVSWLLHHKTELEDMRIWLYGNRGGAQWPLDEIYSQNNETRQLLDTAIQLPHPGIVPRMEAHARECVEFARAIAQGAPSPVPAEQSLDVISILDGIYRSSESGKEVSLA